MAQHALQPRLSWLTQGKNTLPSARFRVYALESAAAGHFRSVTVDRIPKTLAPRIAFYASLPRADIRIIQKRLLSPLELAMVRRRSCVVAYDFDDAVWTEQDVPRPVAEGQHTSRFLHVCRHVDTVIAGNAFLASAVPQDVNCHIMPTPVDTSFYVPGEKGSAATPVVGWMGTASYLDWLEPVVRRVENAGLPMHVVSNREPGFSCASMQFSQWSSEDELALLQGFDIGLMPLEDTLYSRGKGGFKLLQYMACGVVPIASAVGMNTEIITHGENGFLVSDDQEWEIYVRLLQQHDLRQKMAQAARETACRRFDLQQAASGLFAHLKTLLWKR